MFRVTLAQVKFLSFTVDSRYSPVKEEGFGILMLKDRKPGEPETFVTPSTAAGKECVGDVF